MTESRTPRSSERHVHMSHVRDHLARATRHAAIIHGREVELHPDSPVPPYRSAAPPSPQSSRAGDGAASSTPPRNGRR